MTPQCGYEGPLRDPRAQEGPGQNRGTAHGRIGAISDHPTNPADPVGPVDPVDLVGFGVVLDLTVGLVRLAIKPHPPDSPKERG